MKRFLLALLCAASFGVFAAGSDYVDYSGTITLGGTSQTLRAATPNGGRTAITNPTLESEVLCVNVTSAASCSAAGSWQIKPGETLTLDSDELITVIAATTGHKFTAKRVTSGFSAAGPGAGAGSSGLTDAELRATPVPVSGTVGVTGVSTATNQTAVQAPVAPAAATATKSELIGCIYNSAGVTLTDGQQGAVQCNNKGSVIVGGLAAVGSAPASNPVSVAGIDGSGNKQHMLTKTDGTVQTNDVAMLAKFTATANADATRAPVSLGLADPRTGTAASAVVLSNMPFAVGREAQSVIVNVTANTATANFEWSTDGVVPMVPHQCWIYNNTGGSGPVASTTSASTYICPVRGTHFQVRQSGAGGVTATVLPVTAPSGLAMGANIGGGSVFAIGAATEGTTANSAPLQTGCEARTSAKTAVTNGQAIRIPCKTTGEPVIYLWSIPDLTWQYASAADVTDTTSTEMKAAVASTRNYVNGCVFSNTDATVGTYVNILSASTVIGVVYVGAQVAATTGLNSLPVQFTPPLRGAVNEAINFQAVTTSAQLRVACQGFASVH